MPASAHYYADRIWRLLKGETIDGAKGLPGGENFIGYTGFPDTLRDAFGFVPTSEPFTLFDSQLTLSSNPLYWEDITVGSATGLHQPTAATYRLRVSGANGDKRVRQSKRTRYQPGKGQLVLITFVLGAAVAGTRRRIGYFDERNGIFLEQTSSGLFLVQRNETSDAVRYAQSTWNQDKLNGSDASGITLDPEKSQILIIDLEWLGVGRVRVGFVIDGKIYWAHFFNNANNIVGVYMQNANLPIRYEIENTSVGVQSDLYQICNTVISQGGRQEKNLVFHYQNTTSRSVTNTILPLLSIRLADKFPAAGSIVNREQVQPLSIDIYTEDAAIAWFTLWNPATLTDANWQNFDTTHSGVQYDISASALTGGVRLGQAGFAVATNQQKGTISELVLPDLTMQLNAAGNASDIFTIAAVRLTGTSSDTWAGIQWRENY